MLPRFLLALLLLGLLAEPARAGGIRITYEILPGSALIDGQGYAVTGGALSFSLTGGATTVGGTVSSGPATISTLSVGLTRPFPVSLPGGTTLSIQTFRIPEASLPCCTVDTLGKLFLRSQVQVSPSLVSPSITFTLYGATLTVTGTGPLRISGRFNPLFTLFASAREVARSPVPEPGPGWLLFSGVAGGAALVRHGRRSRREGADRTPRAAPPPRA